MRIVLVRLLDLALFLQRRGGLQHAHVRRHVARGQIRVDLIAERAPRHRQNVLVGQLFEQDDCIRTVVHGAVLVGREFEWVGIL